MFFFGKKNLLITLSTNWFLGNDYKYVKNPLTNMLGDIYKIKFILPNIGDAEGELIRIKGPHLTELINRNLPINSRGLKREDMFFIPIDLLYAAEKPTTIGNRGDIVYEPNSKALIILVNEKKFDTKIANIGSITKNLDIFDNLKMSSGVRIEQLEE